MISSAIVNSFLVPIGTKEFSPIINVPINGFLFRIPLQNNCIIKKISVGVSCNDINQSIENYFIRFRLLNRDISLNTNLAGNILNPISSPWDGSLPKDSIMDFILGSKKQSILFPDGIFAGGVQFQTLRFNLTNISTVSFSIVTRLEIQYEQ